MESSAIIDSHHHLWRVERNDYHWMAPTMGLPLRRDYLPGDLAPLLHAAGVDRTIVVQAAETEAETDFLLDLAEKTDFIAGVVGWLDMEDRAFADKLDRLRERPKFVGLRPMLQDTADDAYILRPAVLDNLRILAARGVPFDILTYPRHLRNVAEALRRVPGLNAVVNHLSKPPVASGVTRGWADDLARLAAFPTVSCKLSGLITEADHDGWEPADLQPYIDHALAQFGPERLMFGSDWPVCLLAGTYDQVMDALRTTLDGKLSAEERRAVYGRNAMRVYGLHP